jgi:general secretion pathway protein J
MQRDVEMRAGIELTEPKKVGTEDEPATAPPAVTVRSSDSKGFRLDIIRSAADQPGALQRVRWWLKGDTLYRAVAPARNRYPLPAPTAGVAVLGRVSDLQVRVWEMDKGWRQLSGNRREDPLGLEVRLTRETAQGVEKYRQVMGPLQ